MRYEKPELALLGTAAEVVLGPESLPPFENVDSRDDTSLIGYEE
jgi:hypothetical protein